MKLSKGQIILLIITSIIVITNLVYFQISNIDEPIFIKRYSELFYDTNINLEFIRNNTSIKEEEELFESNTTSNIMNIEFPEINKSYDMFSYSYNEFKNKYEYLTYRLGVNESEEEDGLYDYIDKNGPVKLTRAILNTYEGETYDIDLGEIILNPFKTNANGLVQERGGYSESYNENSMIWIANKDVYINKIESRYLEELKKYYDFSLLIGDEKISIDKIKYPFSIKENTTFRFSFVKKNDVEIDVKNIYDTEIKIEIEDNDKNKENLYVRVRNINPYDILSERNILKLKY